MPKTKIQLDTWASEMHPENQAYIQHRGVYQNHAAANGINMEENKSNNGRQEENTTNHLVRGIESQGEVPSKNLNQSITPEH
ncbi:hypothetical protein PIB30_094027, partial [Stylosanthes scabra]|nr:hypothetical protein [Stylosanthes scabra]